VSLIAKYPARVLYMTRSLFIIRQPIYAAFALTAWTVPVWTPDQLFHAIGLTSAMRARTNFKEAPL
jgi:hypothetical protein